MPDEITAQKLLQDWARGRGFSTTQTCNPDTKLYFHYGEFNGFAILDFSKSPALKLVISNKPSSSANKALLMFNDWNPKPVTNPYDEYDLNLADEKVLSKIERILDRTIDSYLEG